jgi:hypothetical protein
MNYYTDLNSYILQTIKLLSFVHGVLGTDANADKALGATSRKPSSESASG